MKLNIDLPDDLADLIARRVAELLADQVTGPTDPDRLLTVEEAAEYLRAGVAPGRCLRCLAGCPFRRRLRVAPAPPGDLLPCQRRRGNPPEPVIRGCSGLTERPTRYGNGGSSCGGFAPFELPRVSTTPENPRSLFGAVRRSGQHGPDW